jgi:pilus assembly protein CpaF
LQLLDLAKGKEAVRELTPEKWELLRKKSQEEVIKNVPREYLGKYRDTEAKNKVRYHVRNVVGREYPNMPEQAKYAIIERLTNEISGFGPLEKLLDNPEITEIIVERYDTVVVEKDGVLQETDITFDSEEHLRLVIERIISPMGRRLDWASPIVDGRLPDGSRICAVAPPVSPNGTQLTIRKFKPNLSFQDLIELGALSEEIADALRICVNARLSTIISGGTGSGKSTFLNALSEFIDPNLSIITIENPMELQLKHPRVRQWEARPANIEGRGEIDMMSLVIAALRSRPDIIIVGEVRGKEAFALMQALNTGHNGSMTTLHANNTQEAMYRLISMVSASNQLAPELVPSFIASGIDIIVHLSRMPDGSRKVVEIAEVVGEQDGKIITNKLVEYKLEGYDANNKVVGRWQPTGNQFLREERLKSMGISFKGWGV